MCRIWLNRNLIRCTIWLCYSGDMFTSAGMSQWPSMFTRPSGELHESGEELFSLIAFVLLLAWAWSSGECCSWGNCSFQMVCGLFCHRFAAALLFFHSLSLSNAWLRALLWNMRTERERERERGERKQQTASCCPISIHLHSRLFFELAQTNLKRFMVIAISPDNELS